MKSSLNFWMIAKKLGQGFGDCFRIGTHQYESCEKPNIVQILWETNIKCEVERQGTRVSQKR